RLREVRPALVAYLSNDAPEDDEFVDQLADVEADADTRDPVFSRHGGPGGLRAPVERFAADREGVHQLGYVAGHRVSQLGELDARFLRDVLLDAVEPPPLDVVTVLIDNPPQ